MERRVFKDGALIAVESTGQQPLRLAENDASFAKLEARISKLEGKPPKGTKVTAVELINASQRMAV